jgi:hypothetical protein
MTMKKLGLLACILLTGSILAGQTDKEQLALRVAKAEEQNLARLKEYIWKRHSNVFLDNQMKLTTVTEFRFNTDGKLETQVIDASSSVQQKPGLRGAAQKSAAEDKLDYLQQALQLSVAYAFLSKGELVDFFDKATITEQNDMLEAVAANVLVQGDRLMVRIDPESDLILYREFTSLLGKDMVDGKLYYDSFSNGTVHGTMTTINMPVQKMKIEGSIQDYTIRIN